MDLVLSGDQNRQNAAWASISLVRCSSWTSDYLFKNTPPTRMADSHTHSSVGGGLRPYLLPCRCDRRVSLRLLADLFSRSRRNCLSLGLERFGSQSYPVGNRPRASSDRTGRR